MSLRVSRRPLLMTIVLGVAMVAAVGVSCFVGDFPLPAASEIRNLPAGCLLAIAVPDEGLDFEQLVSHMERTILEQALRKTGGNKAQAAEMLRLKRTTLSAKLKSLGAVAIEPEPTAA